MGPAINSKCFLPLSSRRGGWSLKFSEGRDNVSLILHLYVKHLTVCVVYRPVVQSLSCVQLCNPMDWSTPSFPVLHYLLEFPQTHVHWVSDAIQPSHPLLASFLLPLISASIRIVSSEWALCIRWPNIGASASASVLPVNIQGWFPLGLTGLNSLLSKGLTTVFSSTTVWKHLFLVDSLLYGPTLTSAHDY